MPDLLNRPQFLRQKRAQFHTPAALNPFAAGANMRFHGCYNRSPSPPREGANSGELAHAHR